MAYSEEERAKIIQYHLASGNSVCKTSREFGINGSMTLSRWLKKLEDSKKNAIFAGENQIVEPMQEQKEQDLQRRIIELEAALKHEQMKNLALNTMIDIAEEQGIQIRKKSGAKQ